MPRRNTTTNPLRARTTRARGRWCVLAVALLFASGCAAFHPLKGTPAAQLSDEFRLPMRSAQQTIDLSLLRQSPPSDYRLDAGDVLGVYIEGVLGRDGVVPPVTAGESTGTQPSVGYPIRVRDDGTIKLPQLKPFTVRGLTLAQLDRALRHAYTTVVPLLRDNEQRPASRAPILVNVLKPRTHRVLVIRQESGNRNGNAAFNGDSTENGKRGTGRVVQLPAYQNDVLHALAQTGGLPGLDAENAVYVIRNGCYHQFQQMYPELSQRVDATQDASLPSDVIRGQAPHGAPWVGHSTDSPQRPPATAPGKRFTSVQDFLRRVSGGSSSKAAPTAGNATAPPQTDRRLVVPPAPGSKFTPIPRARRPLKPPVARSRPPQLQPQPKPRLHQRPSQPVRLPPVTRSPAIRQPAIEPTAAPSGIIRIPLRAFPGEPLPFSPADVVLHDGDIVFIESREQDAFYTGGLLGGGRYLLPRDYDIDVLQAMAIVHHRQREQNVNVPTRTIGGISALNRDVSIGASSLIVLRKVPCGGQIEIEVDLKKALADPEERIMVRPGDHLVLQYTRCEAAAAFFERHIIEGLVLGISSSLFFNN